MHVFSAMLAEMDWGRLGTGALFLLFIVASIFLILAVLVQKPQGGGLAGAFGSGAGSGQTAFGARTGDALTVMTIIMFVFFLASGIALGVAIRPSKVDPLAPKVSGTSKPADKPADAPAEKPADKPAEKPAADSTPAPSPTTPPPAPAPAPAPANPAPANPAPADPAKPSGH